MGRSPFTRRNSISCFDCHLIRQMLFFSQRNSKAPPWSSWWRRRAPPWGWRYRAELTRTASPESRTCGREELLLGNCISGGCRRRNPEGWLMRKLRLRQKRSLINKYDSCRVPGRSILGHVFYRVTGEPPGPQTFIWKKPVWLLSLNMLLEGCGEPRGERRPAPSVWVTVPLVPHRLCFSTRESFPFIKTKTQLPKG